MQGIHQWLVDSLHKGPVIQKVFHVLMSSWSNEITQLLCKMTRYVYGTSMFEVTPVTIWYICPPHHAHTSQYYGHEWMTHCPACRTSLIATRFWVVMICPIIKCLTVLEFSFILFDLCLFITIFNFILNYVPIVTFWIFTYHKIWILLIIFCFIWSYWIIYFLICLDAFWSVVS